MVMMQGVKAVALFLGYSAVGMGGDAAADLLGQALTDAKVVDGAHVAVEVAHVRHVSAHQTGQSSCRYEAERSVSLDLAGARELAIDAGSGSLTVAGVEGLDRVEAVARACASDEEELDDLFLTLEQRGGGLLLETHYPDRSSWDGWGGRDHYARLDLEVRIPKGLDLDVDDSSGGMELVGTGALRIDDSSGSIYVEDAQGSVVIDDSSGEIEVTGVAGDVEVDDGSGDISLMRVEGSVRLRDGSGGVRVEGVDRDVVVDDDGSGSISVRDVGGDFRVRSDGSGSIRYDGVAGSVEIPRDKRRGRRGS